MENFVLDHIPHCSIEAPERHVSEPEAKGSRAYGAFLSLFSANWGAFADPRSDWVLVVVPAI